MRVDPLGKAERRRCRKPGRGSRSGTCFPGPRRTFMFASLRRCLNPRTVRPLTKRGRRPALQVEALEGRDLPTVAFTAHFGAETTAGSTVYSLQSPPVNLVFS